MLYQNPSYVFIPKDGVRVTEMLRVDPIMLQNLN
jgi:hypothetical protein